MFLVTHSSQIVRDTCNRAVWLEQGRVVMDGDVNEVVDAYDADVKHALEVTTAGGPGRQAGAATR